MTVSLGLHASPASEFRAWTRSCLHTGEPEMGCSPPHKFFWRPSRAKRVVPNNRYTAGQAIDVLAGSLQP